MSYIVSLDEKDVKILKILAKNARIPYSEIAKIVELSDVAVIRRVRKLEQSGIIKGYTLIVDPKKLGFNSISITGIDVEPEHLFEVIDKLRNMENVKYIALTTGDHSIIIIVWARNGEEMAKIHDMISKIPGVKRVCPAIILDVFKDERV